MAAVVLVAAMASDGSDPQETDPIEAADTTTTSVHEPSTTTQSPSTTTYVAEDAEIPKIAAGCVGMVGGLWLTAALDDDFDQIIAEHLTECWDSPPDRLEQEANAFDAYCVGYGAGASLGGYSPEDANDVSASCLSNDGGETHEAFLAVLLERATLLDEKGVSAWLEAYGPADEPSATTTTMEVSTTTVAETSTTSVPTTTTTLSPTTTLATTTTSSATTTTAASNDITPGAYCSPVGATGSYNGKAYVCATTNADEEPYSDGRAHWRRA